MYSINMLRMKFLGLFLDLFLDLSLLFLLGCLELLVLHLTFVFFMGRCLNGIRHDGTLNMVFQDTSNQCKKVPIKLCTSLKE